MTATVAEYVENEDEAVEALFAADGHWKRPPSLWETPTQALEQKQFWQVFARCIAGLPAAQAHAFRLCEIVGWEGNEACKVLGISATNLWVLLHRARLRLRQCLEIQWFGRKAKVER
ncbi:MAG TPA: sigma factor-like helix-turn-helix DNA-binding protein [Acidiferrobacterales bacterium]|nr:sigma factor-like helix-turn-helix DNA-binding protein [Acidiferrobacterales bacterium]